jgi:hypothetical protein
VLELRSWWGGEILGDIFGDDFAWWKYARVLEIISDKVKDICFIHCMAIYIQSN